MLLSISLNHKLFLKLARVYSHNKDLNDIEKKYSTYFLEEQLLKKNLNLLLSNSQSLNSLIKYPQIQPVYKNQNSDREPIKLDKKETYLKHFDLNSLLTNEPNVLPIITKKNLKFSERKESPYAAEKKLKKLRKTRMVQLIQRNYNVKHNIFTFLQISFKFISCHRKSFKISF